MNSEIIKGFLSGIDVAFAYASTAAPVEEIILNHNCGPVAAHLLGRALTGALLSASLLPEKQKLNTCWKYQGSLRTIVVDAGQDGTVRGFISPAEIEADDLNQLYGDIGTLQTVTSDSTGKVLNSGTTPVALHDAVKDLAYAHCISDQIETCMSVMIGFNPDPKHPVHLCRGLMIQALPGSNLECFERLRQRMEGPLFRSLLGTETAFNTLTEVLTTGESGFTGLRQDAGILPRFFCPCNREKMEAVVRTLPIPERMELVQKKEPVKINCQFCNRHYELSIDECIAAWNRKSA